MNWEKLHFPTGSREKLRVVRRGKHLPDSDCGICICLRVCVCESVRKIASIIAQPTASAPKRSKGQGGWEEVCQLTKSVFAFDHFRLLGTCKGGRNARRAGGEKGMLTLRLLLLQGVHACRRWYDVDFDFRIVQLRRISMPYFTHTHTHKYTRRGSAVTSETAFVIVISEAIATPLR